MTCVSASKALSSTSTSQWRSRLTGNTQVKNLFPKLTNYFCQAALVDGGRSLPRVYNEISRQIKYLQGAEKKPVRGPKPTPIELSHQQRGLLEQIVRRQTSPQNQVRRAKIILCMGEGKNNQQTAQSLKVHP